MFHLGNNPAKDCSKLFVVFNMCIQLDIIYKCINVVIMLVFIYRAYWCNDSTSKSSSSSPDERRPSVAII